MKLLENVISLNQAAHISGYSQDYLGYLIRSGEMKGVKKGGVWFITEDEIKNYIFKQNNQNKILTKLPQKKLDVRELLSRPYTRNILVFTFLLFIGFSSFAFAFNKTSNLSQGSVSYATKQIGSSLQSTSNDLAYGWSSFANGLLNNITDSVNGTKEFAVSVGDGVKFVSSGIAEGWTSTKNFAINVSLPKIQIPKIQIATKTSTSSLTASVGNSLTSVSDGLVYGWSAFTNGILNNITNSVNGTKEFAVSVLDGAKFVGNGIVAGWNSFKLAVGNIVKFIASIWNPTHKTNLAVTTTKKTNNISVVVIDNPLPTPTIPVVVETPTPTNSNTPTPTPTTITKTVIQKITEQPQTTIINQFDPTLLARIQGIELTLQNNISHNSLQTDRTYDSVSRSISGTSNSITEKGTLNDSTLNNPIINNGTGTFIGTIIGTITGNADTVTNGVYTSRTVNGHALSSDVTVTPTDLGLVIGTNVLAQRTFGTAAAQDVGYFATALQGSLADAALPSSSFTDAAVIGKFLTGYTSSTGTISSSDSILSAIQKLNGNVLANGSGTVTSVSVTTANGVSGSVATDTTTPAITLTLGAITPTSVNGVVISGSGTPTLSITGTTSLSGTSSGSNTGDETLTTIKTKLGVANTTTDGYLSTADWNTFNGKQVALVNSAGLSTAIGGDVAVADGGTGTSTGSITGTGALVYTAGGTNQNVTLTPSGTGYTILNGNVGIGTTTPTTPLHVGGTLSASSGYEYGVYVNPTITQTGTAGYTALYINATQSTVGSGALGLINAAFNGLSVFGVGIDGYIETTGGFKNNSSITYAQLSLATTGPSIVRNRADAVPALTIINNNASSTGDIVQFKNSGGIVAYINQAGKLGLGISPTAILHLKAGTATANTAPIKFTSGTLLGTAEVGAIEFLTDAYYGTITTGAVRKQFAFTSDITGTNSGTNTGDNAANSTYTIGSQTQAYNSNLTAINQALTTTSSPSFTAVGATTFTGALTGTASGNYAPGGTDIAVADGGTGLSTIADGSILATNTADTLSAITWHSAGTKILTNTSGTITWEVPASGMVYPGAGIPNSTGSAWDTSYTTSGTGTVLALATSPAFVTSVTGGVSFDVFNTTSTTINAFGAATTLTLGAGATSLTAFGTTAATTLNIGSGATTTGLTKTLNLGTSGATGSTTAINIGTGLVGTGTIILGTVTTGTTNIAGPFQLAGTGVTTTAAKLNYLTSAGGTTGTTSTNLVFSTTPTFTTNITTPLVLGGSSTTSPLTFQTTSGVGTTGADMHFLVGNAGGTEAMTILNNGNVGVGTTTPSQQLEITKNFRLPATTGSTVGVIMVGIDRFIHNFALTGTDGYNTFVGINSGNFTMTGSTGAQGSYNTANGYNTLKANTTGNNNTANGYNALTANTTGHDNTANGMGALRTNTTGNNNTVIGGLALYANTSGSNNTATGYYALNANTTGSYNTASGNNALQVNTTGVNNTANGYSALSANTTGHENTANGVSALRTNTTGHENTANGAFALYANTIGNENTATGYYALHSNTEGVANIANGAYAFESNTTGSWSTAVGNNALSANTVGYDNTAIGYSALHANTDGNYNVAVGNSVLLNVRGSYNVAMGWRPGYGLPGQSDISNNVLIGYSAGYDLLTGGDNNTLIGYQSGYNITTGAKNIYLGSNTTIANANITTGSNNIVIGNDVQVASATASNQLNIGNLIFGTGLSGTGTTIAGAIGIGTTTPSALLHTQSSNGGVTGGIMIDNTWSGGYSSLVMRDNRGSNSYVGQMGLYGTGVASPNTSNMFFYNTAGGGIGFYVGSGTPANDLRMLINSSGNVGIGTTTGLSKLSINGGLHVGGDSDAGNDNLLVDGTINGLLVNQGTNSISGNTAVGVGALDAVNTGTGNNTAIGYVALSNNTSGTNNTANGASALPVNTTGYNNTANGYASLYLNTSGSKNTAIGADALEKNITGYSNVALGNSAGKYELGSNAFYIDNQNRTDTTGDKAKALLYGTFNATAASQTLVTNSAFTATYGITVPTGQSYKITGGTSSQFLKADGSLDSSTYLTTTSAGTSYVPYTGATGAVNLGAYDLTVNGITVGKGHLGNSTTAVGYNALASNIANGNTAFGYYSLASVTTGPSNAAFGDYTLQHLVSGDSNSAFGELSLYNVLGKRNTGLGDNTLYNLVLGDSNIAVGASAGVYTGSASYLTTSNNSIFIGYDSRPLIDASTNEIVIGSVIIGHGSNTATWGNTSITNHYFSGDIGATGARLTKLWSTDIESTNIPTVGGISLATMFAPSSVYPATGLTTGYVPYKSSTVLANSPIYTDGSGNVGIGTTTPVAKLDVYNTTAGSGLSSMMNLTNGFDADINFKVTQVGAATKYVSISPSVAVNMAFVLNGGNVGIGTTTPTALLHLKAGTAIAGTAPLKFTSGTVLGTTEAGAVEYDGSHLYFTATASGPRFQLDQQSGGSGLSSDADFNTKGGTSAGLNLVSGAQYNTFLGYEAGKSGAGTSTNAADNNTAIGYQSLFSNTTGYSNTANGYQSLYSNTEGAENIANGYQSLYSNTTGADNIANGNFSLYSNTSGSANTANGYYSLNSNTTGDNNTANGYFSLYSNTNGQSNTANGSDSLNSNTTGNFNTANGYYSLAFNTTGSSNTANGNQSLVSNTTGSSNTANGYQSLWSNVANSRSTAIGFNSMYYANNTTTGISTYNTALGYESLKGSATAANNTGTYNTAIGDSALWSNTSGSYNSAQGYATLYSNANGWNNTAQGYSALYDNSGGDSNVAFGSYAGAHETGSNSFYINNIDQTTTANDKAYSLLYGTFSGAAGDLTGQQLVINGNVGIGNISPSYLLHVGNGSSTATGTTVARFQNAGGTCDVVPSTTGGITCTSDMRLKKNITTLSGESWSLSDVTIPNDASILDKILALTPVQFNMLAEQNGSSLHTGFIAQEVENIFPDLVRADNQGNLSLNYTGLTPYMVQAIQEMNLKVSDLSSLDTTSATSLGSLMKGFLENVGNNVSDLYAVVIHSSKVETKMLCVSDETGAKTCIDKAQLDSLMASAGGSGGGGGSAPEQTATVPADAVSSGEATPAVESPALEPVVVPVIEPAPEPVVAPVVAPVVDSTPTPAPTENVAPATITTP